MLEITGVCVCWGGFILTYRMFSATQLEAHGVVQGIISAVLAQLLSRPRKYLPKGENRDHGRPGVLQVNE